MGMDRMYFKSPRPVDKMKNLMTNSLSGMQGMILDEVGEKGQEKLLSQGFMCGRRWPRFAGINVFTDWGRYHWANR